MASTPCLSLSSFSALLELEPQHFDDSVGVLVRIVLSASGPVDVEAVFFFCCFCCCDVVGRCGCCSVACCCCCGSVDKVGFVVSICGRLLSSQILLSWSMCLSRVRVSPSLVIISRISFSAGDAIGTCPFAHLIAVTPCDTKRLLPSTPMNLVGNPSSVLATDGLHDVFCSSVLHLQERNHLSLVWTLQSSSF